MPSYYDETRVDAGRLAAQALPLDSLPEARMREVLTWLVENDMPNNRPTHASRA